MGFFRVVEVTTPGWSVGVYRGFLCARPPNGQERRIPLGDVGAVIVSGRGIGFSHDALVRLAEAGVAVVLCSPNHVPVAWMWPLAGHHRQTAVMAAQLSASRPLGKRLWQTLIRAKVAAQGEVLRHLRGDDWGLGKMARKVRSGDPDNLEAQAARTYFPALFGAGFRRDRSLPGRNAQLNYGYIVLRSAVARAVVAAGLHPSVGVHHHHRDNPMPLVDDLMEPFRPAVDLAVAALPEPPNGDLPAPHREALVALLDRRFPGTNDTPMLRTAAQRAAQSLAASFEERRPRLELLRSVVPKDALEDQPRRRAGFISHAPPLTEKQPWRNGDGAGGNVATRSPSPEADTS